MRKGLRSVFWGLVWSGLASCAAFADAPEEVEAIVEQVRLEAGQWQRPEVVDWSEAKLSPGEVFPNSIETLPLSPERLSGLLNAIDLNYPGLEKVRELFNAGNLPAAGFALVEYYRTRPWSENLADDVTGIGPNYEVAELALRDIHEQGGHHGRQPRTAEGQLDWEDRGPRDSPEWSWWVNRMGYLVPVTAMWEASGDRRYAQFANAVIADWVRANPYPGGRSFSAAWRPLEVARRIDRAWLYAFFRLSESTDFSPETRLLMLSSIPDHADALMNYPSLWGNHLLTEKVMLGLLAVAFPEFKDADAWLSNSVESVAGLIEKQVYPDGAYEELTNHYQLVALLSFQRYLEILEVSGKQESIDRVKPTIERMWDYFAYVMRPDGNGPMNNDSDLKNNRAELQRALRIFDRPDWEFLASNGQVGESPGRELTRYYPWAGHAIMRDGWTGDAQWAFFDIGPYGSDHHHNDRLHLSLSFGGKDFLVDSGRYDYTPGAMRDYFTGPMGHNTVMLDGQAPLPGPGKVGAPMEVIAKMDGVGGLFQAEVKFPASPTKGKGPKTHRRTVQYLQGVKWTVIDEVIAFGPTDVEVRWLFHPGRVVEKTEHGLITTDAEGANFRMELISDDQWEVELLRGQEEPFPAGWYSPVFNNRYPATQAIFKTKVASPTRFVWLIAPADADWDALLLPYQ
ncbi:alginate lyase family protein [Cerasicoccus fimbriatus]|uniref:alginate lyase family protein n=1 Tax=Cerasicoccus fimbriatus TaxID=3014554 RepID=UPI0022B4E905|nr:alginate lyase family protein [Cerasicoccus sp. TK19100]